MSYSQNGGSVFWLFGTWTAGNCPVIMQSYRQELYKQYILRAYRPGQLRLRFMQVPAELFHGSKEEYGRRERRLTAEKTDEEEESLRSVTERPHIPDGWQITCLQSRDCLLRYRHFLYRNPWRRMPESTRWICF